MKWLYHPAAFLVVIYSLAACKERVYELSGEIAPPSQTQQDSIKELMAENQKVVEQSTPKPVIEKAAQSKEKRANDSPFRKTGCCADQAPPAICCCDAVLGSYLNMLRNGQVKEVAEIRAKDPILNDCIKMVPDFKRKIDELEMGGEEE